MAVIFAGVYGVLNIGDKVYHEDLGLLGLQQGVRQAMDGMTREVRQSGATYNLTTNGTQLDFCLPNISNTTVRYSLNANKQVIRTLFSGNVSEDKVLANNISNLTFCCLGGGNCTNCTNAHSLEIQIRSNKTVRERGLSFPRADQPPLTERVKLRN